MIIRPVFISVLDSQFFIERRVSFNWYAGQNIANIEAVHRAFLEKKSGICGDLTQKDILEISSKSPEFIGKKLSALNLKFMLTDGNTTSVEAAFQSSKVFEHGGPYKDLLYAFGGIAKKDKRLKNSGKLIGFDFEGERFDTEPKTFFYDWLYINALVENYNFADELMKYSAFTDIFFAPDKSINSQARSAAIYVSLRRQDLLDDALESAEAFKQIVYGGSHLK